MVDTIINNIIAFITSYTIHDIIGLVVAFLLFTLSITFTILFKNTILKFLMFIITIAILIISPIGVKVVIDKSVRLVDMNITEQKRLNFADTVVVVGTLTNRGLINLNSCKLKAVAINSGLNEYLIPIFKYLQPLYQKSEDIELKESFIIDSTIDFRFVLDKFTIREGQYQLFVDSECY